MAGQRSAQIICGLLLILVGVWCTTSFGKSHIRDDSIYDPGKLKATDTSPELKIGDPAPDFTLPTTSGSPVSLGALRGKKAVVISFVPAAWTPVCSQQWPGYNIAKEYFDEADAVMIGISVDNVPTLYAWTKEMGKLWFPVASDFWPHGAVAQSYGVLRRDGTSERALFLIDRHGIIRYIDVHDINEMPKLEVLVKELEKLKNSPDLRGHNRQ